MVVLRRLHWCWLPAIQKILFLLFFQAIPGTLWIISFHLRSLLGPQLRQVTNESHQFPAILLSSRISESRHARKSHAILNHPKKFTIGNVLRLLQSEIRRLGIQAFSQQTVSAPVIAMATRAMIREM